MSIEQGALGLAVLALMAAVTVLIRKVSRYMDARIRLAETQAKREENDTARSDRDLELREWQVEIDRRKLHEMRRSRKVQQQACNVRLPDDEDTGSYHMDPEEMAWAPAERPFDAEKRKRPEGGTPSPPRPKDDEGARVGRLSLVTMMGG